MSLFARNDIIVKIMVPYGVYWHRNHPNTYWGLTVFFMGGASWGCSKCNTQSRLWWGVTFPVLQHTHPRDNTPTPTPQSGITRACERTPKPQCILWGKVSVYQPLIWGGFGVGRIYIKAFVEHFPLGAAPWGQAIDDEWWSVLHSRVGRSPHGPLTLCQPPNDENTKAWSWTADGNSYQNKWSHLWVIKKLISSMEKIIVDGGNCETNEDSNSSKWMILHT